MDENQQPSVTQEKLPVIFAILSHVKSSDFRFVTCFMLFLKFDLQDFELVLLRMKICHQRKHVLNYASKNGLGTK